MLIYFSNIVEFWTTKERKYLELYEKHRCIIEWIELVTFFKEISTLKKLEINLRVFLIYMQLEEIFLGDVWPALLKKGKLLFYEISMFHL